MNDVEAKETKPLRRLRDSLTTGNLWLHMLSLMKAGKVYAYALPESMEKEFRFRPNRVMVYVVLYKLEAEGLIGSAFEERRKYYHLTRKGADTLRRGKKYLAALSRRL
ncbi:MAG: helix-turn-helix transcriptional regulator [Candidatus ainarchaeum sp.]|nr:helix-turn-helix transcriptional regulator [Candidatus ainarchaeum sp.]